MNSTHPLPRQRFTAAHELGHHFLQHGTSIDPEGEPLSRWGSRIPPDHEKTAEAFAAWFLMPRDLIRLGLERLGVQLLRNEVDAYRLSTFVGCSYEATVRHLVSLQLISRAMSTNWLKTRPGAVKELLAGAARPENARNDVVVLDDRASGLRIEARPGDRLFVDLAEPSSSGYEWELDVPDGAAIVDEEYPFDDEIVDGGDQVHRFVVAVRGNGAGGNLMATLTRGWPSNDDTPEPTTDTWGVSLLVAAVRRGVNPRWLERPHDHWS